jgi:nucleotide-binding universal stress UspA family protein
MYKTVLAPLDGSIRAEAILPHVESIATTHHAKVYLVRVEEPPLSLGFDEVLNFEKYREEFERKKKDAQAYLEEKKGQLEKKGIKVETRLAFGQVVKTILDVAEEIQADLVAMASHGFSGSQRMFYGSVAAAMLHRIDRPLLMIRTRKNL